MIKPKVCPTDTATIWVGFGDATPGVALKAVKVLCSRYCDAVGLCVTITPTTFVYTGGLEKGAAVGLINYPRFSEGRSWLRRHALELAEQLQIVLAQKRVSIVFPDETVMLEEECKTE